MVATAIVAGVGPYKGLGAVLSRKAAGEGLHVFVAGRTLEKLEAVAEAIRAQREQEGRLIDLDGIADIYIQLHCQKRSAWSFEIDVRTHAEPW